MGNIPVSAYLLVILKVGMVTRPLVVVMKKLVKTIDRKIKFKGCFPTIEKIIINQELQ
jgi:hypothetical protein